MWVKITRGLGGKQGITVLIMTLMVGASILLIAWTLRLSLTTQLPVGAATTPEEIMENPAEARGRMAEIPYGDGELARVATFASALTSQGKWIGLPANSVLEVIETKFRNQAMWVSGVAQGTSDFGTVTVHASFLTRYNPVVLDRSIEVSDVRLVHLRENTPPRIKISGFVRNIAQQTVSQCVVTCVFRDDQGRQLDIQPTGELLLSPFEFVRFESGQTDPAKQFSSVSLEISHATSEGLRNYLPVIEIQYATDLSEPPR